MRHGSDDSNSICYYHRYYFWKNFKSDDNLDQILSLEFASFYHRSSLQYAFLTISCECTVFVRKLLHVWITASEPRFQM